KQAGQGSLELTVDLEQAPRFACQYLAYRLFGIIEELADIRERNFIYNNVMWMRDKKHDHYGWKAYRLFELRISIGKYTGRSANDESPALGELLINVQGHRYVSPNCMLDYDGDPSDINWVVYHGLNVRYENLSADKNLDHEAVYPVLNRQIGNHLGIPMPYRYVRNKVKEHYKKLEQLRELLTERKDINRLFPFTDGEWHCPPKAKVHRLKTASSKLVFNGGRKDTEPHVGIWQYGGYRSPEERCGIFFIMSEEDAQKGGDGRALKRALKEGTDDFKSLARYINTPIQWYNEDVLFKDLRNPMPEIMQRLTNAQLPDGQ